MPSQFSDIFGDIGGLIGASFGVSPSSSGPPADLSTATFSNDRPTPLENVLLYLQRQP